jgi:hypothetical protein
MTSFWGVPEEGGGPGLFIQYEIVKLSLMFQLYKSPEASRPLLLPSNNCALLSLPVTCIGHEFASLQLASLLPTESLYGGAASSNFHCDIKVVEFAAHREFKGTTIETNKLRQRISANDTSSLL